MLSGFVIFQSLNSHDGFLDFLKSRFIRLFSIFWICVLISSLGIFLLHYGDKVLSPTMVLANLTMIPKQFLGVSSYIEGSYWTLEHELFFYFFVGLSCFKFGWKYTFFIYVAIVMLAIVVHFYDVINNLSVFPRWFQSFFMRLYGILNIKYANLFLAGISCYLYRQKKETLYWLVFILSMMGSFFYFPDGAISKWFHGFVIVVIAGLFWFSNLFILNKSLSKQGISFFGGHKLPFLFDSLQPGPIYNKRSHSFEWLSGIGPLCCIRMTYCDEYSACFPSG